MTPDTAALRALADEWRSVTIDPTTVRALCDAADEVERLREEVRDTRAILDAAGTEVRRERARAEAAEDEIAATSETISLLSHRMGDATAQIKRLAAERDAAADEVERLRKAVWASEEIDRRAGMLAGVQAERDASRTAHAALVADLRALVGGDELVSQRAVNPDEYTRRTGDRVPSYLAFYQGAADLAAVIRALLDHHAPTTGETP